MKITRRGRRGQFLILTALIMSLMIITSTTLIAYTSISKIHFSKVEFRNTVIDISLNFRRALAASLAQKTKELNLMASVRGYSGYNTLQEESSSEFINGWVNETLINYAGLGLRLNLSTPQFECRWDSYQAYSRVTSNLTLNIGAYGFEGWVENCVISLEMRILGISEIGEDFVSFYFSLQREYNLSISDLTVSSIKLLYQDSNGVFREVEQSNMQLNSQGEGLYLLRFNATNIASPPKIKMIIQDSRGIVVGSFSEEGTTLNLLNDTVGPQTLNVNLNPNPTSPSSTTTLTAEISDLNSGWSTIVAAEYFVDSIGENGTGFPMEPSDGSFNSPDETVYAQINLTGWEIGNYTIYVHGRDSSGNWGAPSSITLRVMEMRIIHVDRIDMSVEEDWWWMFRFVRAVAVVVIVDEGGSPVEGATVYGEWSDSVSGSVWGITDQNGQVTFYSDWVFWGGTFTFTVTNVVLENGIYDPASNGETSDTITYWG